MHPIHPILIIIIIIILSPLVSSLLLIMTLLIFIFIFKMNKIRVNLAYHAIVSTATTSLVYIRVSATTIRVVLVLLHKQSHSHFPICSVVCVVVDDDDDVLFVAFIFSTFHAIVSVAMHPIPSILLLFTPPSMPTLSSFVMIFYFNNSLTIDLLYYVILLLMCIE